MHGAEPGDLYLDGTGRVWEVRATCSEPTVEATLIGIDEKPVTMGGGVSGRMWMGFRRIATRGDRYPIDEQKVPACSVCGGPNGGWDLHFHGQPLVDDGTA